MLEGFIKNNSEAILLALLTHSPTSFLYTEKDEAGGWVILWAVGKNYTDAGIDLDSLIGKNLRSLPGFRVQTLDDCDLALKGEIIKKNLTAWDTGTAFHIIHIPFLKGVLLIGVNTNFAKGSEDLRSALAKLRGG